MTQIFVASTFFGAMTVSAAIDAGFFTGPGRRRILLVSNNAAIPEFGAPLTDAAGFETLAARFDEVIHWNAEIAPLHPSGWEPRAEDLPVFERLLRDRWRLGDDPVELVAESISTPPARALAAIFHDAEITVYSDGLMSYGPTRNALPHGIGTQITRQLHLDLVPGLEPQLLAEHGVPARIIPEAAFRAVLEKAYAETAPLIAARGPGLAGAALIVGQYLAALEILTGREEDELHVTMLRGAAARGHRIVLFKPHPAAPPGQPDLLAARAAELGVRLLVVDEPVPAEAWCAALRPTLVVGCFSTALVTARRFFGRPVAAVGTGKLLARLAPYENSNRIPVTIIDATVPQLAADGALGDPFIGPDEIETELAPLVAAVSYCMRAATRPDLRGAAADYLREHSGGRAARYFKRRRLTALRLPGGVALAHRQVVAAVLPPSSRRRRAAGAALRRAQRLRSPDGP